MGDRWTGGRVVIPCPRCDGTTRLTIPGGTMPCSNCIGPSYAGIGARATPEPILLEMQSIAMRLALAGWVLRSGLAAGADTAFDKGRSVVGGRAVLRTRTDWQPAIDHAAQFHPAWDRCSDIAKALHARNSLVMLGDWLDKPVSFVVCWTPDGAVTGGTGQALRIATAYGIPVFNLAADGAAARLWEWLECSQ